MVDPDFMSRYMAEPQKGGERQSGSSRDPNADPNADPFGEPDAPEAPAIDEPGREIGEAPRGDRPTTVMPPVGPLTQAPPPFAPDPPPAAAPAGDPGVASSAVSPADQPSSASPAVSPAATWTQSAESAASAATPEPGDPSQQTTPASHATPVTANPIARENTTAAMAPPGRPHSLADATPPNGHPGPRVSGPPAAAAGPPAERTVPAAAPYRHPGAPSTGPQRAVSAAPMRDTGPRWAGGIEAAPPRRGPPTAVSTCASKNWSRSRRVPPEMGWRKAVYVTTGHLVNPGAGPSERALRDKIAAIGSNIPGNYQVGVVSTKGGVGKTRTTAGIGTVFGLYRTEPVIAIDVNPTYGALGRLVDPRATASIREFLADNKASSYPKTRAYTGKNPQGLEVLAGNQNVANPLQLSEDLFHNVLVRTRRFYQLALIDCGSTIEHRVMKGVFGSVDSLVIVGSLNYDGAAAAEQTIDWLAARNAHDLLRRSVVVLNDVYRSEDAKFVTAVRNSLGKRVGEVLTIPWDPHLRDGAVLDYDALRRRTQLAYIDVAAWLSQGFPTAGAGAR